MGKTADKKDILGNAEDKQLGLLKEYLVYDIIQDSNTDCRDTQFFVLLLVLKRC